MPRNNNPEGHNQYTKRADISSKQPQDLSVSSRGMRQESDKSREKQDDRDDSDRSSYRSDRS